MRFSYRYKRVLHLVSNHLCREHPLREKIQVSHEAAIIRSLRNFRFSHTNQKKCQNHGQMRKTTDRACLPISVQNMFDGYKQSPKMDQAITSRNSEVSNENLKNIEKIAIAGSRVLETEVDSCGSGISEKKESLSESPITLESGSDIGSVDDVHLNARESKTGEFEVRSCRSGMVRKLPLPENGAAAPIFRTSVLDASRRRLHFVQPDPSLLSRCSGFW